MKYTEEELVEELQRVSEEYCNGEAPSMKDMREYGNIGTTTYSRRFGSWNKALNKCGLDINRCSNKKISKKDLIEEIKKLSQGGRLKTKKMEEEGKYSIGTYINHFDSWKNAVEKASLDFSNKRYSNEEIIEEVKRVSKEHCQGNVPKTKDFEKYSKYSLGVCRRFETWNEVCKKAGFSDLNNEKLNKETLIREIERVSENHCGSDAPTAQEIEEYSTHSISSYYKYFGSWKNALNEAGFKSSSFRERNKVSEEKVFNELKSFVECHSNEVPEREDFRRADTEVSTRLIREHFGSWGEGLVEVGVDRTKVFGSNYTKEEIIEEFIKENSKKDDLITRREFFEAIGLSTHSFRKHFTKWSELVQQITGKDPFSQRDGYKITKNDLENDYKRISKKYCGGKAPRKKDIKKHSKYSSTTYEKRFGGLKKAAQYFDKEKQTFRLSGENHPRWKGGLDHYYGESWNYRKKEVRKRDKTSCRVCHLNSIVEYGFKPDVHHITPFRYWKVEKEHKKMNHPRNLISLCRSCHSKLEGKFKGRNHEEFEKLAKDYLDIDEKEEKQSVFDY